MGIMVKVLFPFIPGSLPLCQVVGLCMHGHKINVIALITVHYRKIMHECIVLHSDECSSILLLCASI